MSSSGSGYDQSTNTYSRDGRLFQVEYAGKAVDRSGTAIGVRCPDGVVLCVEKAQKSPMVVASSSRRLHTVDDHVGFCASGLLPDGRQLLQRARSEAEGYRDNYGNAIPPSVLTQRLGLYMHYFTLHGAVRPFGSTVLMAGYDADTNEHSLSAVQPNGEAYRFFGVAVGRGKQAAQTEIEKTRLPTKPVAEAIREIARIMLVQREERNRDTPFDLEFSWLTAATGWRHELVPAEVVAEAQQWAAKALADAEMEDDDEDSD